MLLMVSGHRVLQPKLLFVSNERGVNHIYLFSRDQKVQVPRKLFHCPEDFLDVSAEEIQ